MLIRNKVHCMIKAILISWPAVLQRGNKMAGHENDEIKTKL